MGGAAKVVKRSVANPVRSLANIGTFGTYDLARKALPGVAGSIEGFGKRITGQGGNDDSGNRGYPDFSISPEEIAANKAQINDLANSQYDETTKALTGNDPSSLSNLLQEQARNSFARTLPQTAEDYNGGGLLNSTGYQQEVARQQGQLSQDIANRLGQEQYGALQRKQDFGQSALSRGFSLEDFIRQANVAKAIGAQAAPTVPSGKASGLAGGLGGAGVGAKFGPVGAGIGGLAGLLLGSQANKTGKG